MRTLAILAGTLVLGAATADAASASTITATMSVQGAGTISSPTGKGTSIKCDQADPVSGATVLTCPNNPWTKTASGPATMTVTAAPATGWTFDSWGNCPSPAGATCTITTPSTVTIGIRARFVDTTKPEKVPNLKVEGTGLAAPTHVVKWDTTEAGLTW